MSNNIGKSNKIEIKPPDKYCSVGISIPSRTQWLYENTKQWSDSNWYAQSPEDLRIAFVGSKTNHYQSEDEQKAVANMYTKEYIKICLKEKNYENKGLWWALNNYQSYDRYLAKDMIKEVIINAIKKDCDENSLIFKNMIPLLKKDSMILGILMRDCLSKLNITLFLKTIELGIEANNKDKQYNIATKTKDILTYASLYNKVDNWKDNFFEIISMISKSKLSEDITWRRVIRDVSVLVYDKDHEHGIQILMARMAEVELLKGFENGHINICKDLIYSHDALRYFLNNINLKNEEKLECIERILSRNDASAKSTLVALSCIDDDKFLENTFLKNMKEGDFESADKIAQHLESDKLSEIIIEGMTNYFNKEKKPFLTSALTSTQIKNAIQNTKCENIVRKTIKKKI